MEDWLNWTTAIMERKYFVLTETDTYTVFIFVFLHVMLLPKPPFLHFTEYSLSWCSTKHYFWWRKFLHNTISVAMVHAHGIDWFPTILAWLNDGMTFWRLKTVNGFTNTCSSCTTFNHKNFYILSLAKDRPDMNIWENVQHRKIYLLRIAKFINSLH